MCNKEKLDAGEGWRSNDKSESKTDNIDVPTRPLLEHRKRRGEKNTTYTIRQTIDASISVCTKAGTYNT